MARKIVRRKDGVTQRYKVGKKLYVWEMGVWNESLDEGEERYLVVAHSKSEAVQLMKNKVKVDFSDRYKYIIDDNPDSKTPIEDSEFADDLPRKPGVYFE